MIEDRVKGVLNRVATWPIPLQQELAKVALEIEADLADGVYHATADELNAIDEGAQACASPSCFDTATRFFTGL